MLNRYIIERKIPKVGASSDADLAKLAGKSNGVLGLLGPKIQWIQSYVTDDKVYCEYFAENEAVVREHAKMVGLPADSVAKVSHICDPATANNDFEALKSSSGPDREDFLNAS